MQKKEGDVVSFCSNYGNNITITTTATSFNFSGGVTDCYLVVKALGAGAPFNISMTSFSIILSGRAWTYNVGWSAGTLDFNIDFIFAGTGCP